MKKTTHQQKNPLQKTLQKLPKNSCSSQSSQGSTSLSWSLHQQPSPQHFGVMVGSDPSGVVVAGGQEWCPIRGQLPSGSRAQWFSANCGCVKLIFSLDGNPLGNFFKSESLRNVCLLTLEICFFLEPKTMAVRWLITLIANLRWFVSLGECGT